MKVNQASFINKILLFVSLIVLSCFLAVAFVRWQFHDDLFFEAQLANKGVIKFAVEKYLTWDARFLTPFGLFWFILYRYIAFPYILVFVSLSFYGISYYFIKIIELKKNVTFSVSSKIILSVVLNILLWFSIQHILAYTLYWTTASGYILNVFFAVLWLYKYFKKEDGNTKYGYKFLLFSFFVATSSQNITLGLASIVFVDWFVSLFRSQQINFSISASSRFKLLFLFAIGIVVATISPGSLVQLKKMQAATYATSTQFANFKDYLIHFVFMYISAFKSSFYLFLSAIAIFPLLLVFLNKKISFCKINFKQLNFFKLIIANKLYVAAFFSLMVYWPTLLYANRYYVAFYFYLFFAICFTLLSLIKLETESKNSEKYRLFTLPFLLAGLYLFTTTFYESYYVSCFMKKRHQLLEQNRGKSKIILEAINFKKGGFSKTILSSEISDKHTGKENKMLASYYKIDTIVATEFLSKKDLLK